MQKNVCAPVALVNNIFIHKFVQVVHELNILNMASYLTYYLME